jgi:hypothetical protein
LALEYTSGRLNQSVMTALRSKNPFWDMVLMV